MCSMHHEFKEQKSVLQIFCLYEAQTSVNRTSYNCEGRRAVSKRWVSRDHTSAAKCHPDSVIIRGSKIRHQDSRDKDGALRAPLGESMKHNALWVKLVIPLTIDCFLITLSAGDERFDHVFWTFFLHRLLVWLLWLADSPFVIFQNGTKSLGSRVN